MRKGFPAVLLLLICFNFSLSQTINSTGSIYEGEFTPDNKISGLFTYMNNSDQSLVLEVVRKIGNSSEIVLNRQVDPRRGRQLRVYEQEYSTSGEQIFGHYEIFIYHMKNSEKGDLIFSYKNVSDYAPTIRVLSVLFSGISEDDAGQFLEVRLDWQTIHDGTQTDSRKFYIN